jgi:hypothetical protein
MKDNSTEGYVIVEIKLHQIQSLRYLVWSNTVSSFQFTTASADSWKGDTEFRSFMWLTLSVYIYGYSGFIHQRKPPQHNWNTVESGVKHHNPSLNKVTWYRNIKKIDIHVYMYQLKVEYITDLFLHIEQIL